VHLDALVVVVDGDGECALRTLLSNHVLVQDLPDLLGLGEVLELERRRGGQLLIDDLVAEVDALVADVDPGAGDQLLDLALRLAAEAAEELLVGFGGTCQRITPSVSLRPAGSFLSGKLRRPPVRADVNSYAAGGRFPSAVTSAAGARATTRLVGRASSACAQE
jgi:hypothetical protein